MNQKPKNLLAIEAWVKKNRPDLVDMLPQLATTDAAIALLTIGFESGRQFQSENSTLPLNQPHLYLS